MIMNKNPYAGKMRGYLPKAMQEGAKISAVFSALAGEMVRMGEGSKRLMRSRWYHHARGWHDPGDNLAAKGTTELGRIAGLFGLFPGRDESAPHFRQRLGKYVHIHREGLGSARSILRLAALTYRAKSDPQIEWEGNIAVARFTVADGDGKRTLRLELEENPIEPSCITFEKMIPGKSYSMTNHTLDAAAPGLILTTDQSLDRIISVPMLIHKESGIRILYVGKISSGAELHLQSDGPPLLLRNDALQTGGRCFDGDNSVFDTPEGKYGVRFGGPRVLMTGQGSRFNETETTFGSARFAAFSDQLNFPCLQPGKNNWIYRTVKKEELQSYLTGRSDREELLKNASSDDGPPIDLTLSWQGRRPACFSLRIPGDYVPPFMENFKQLQAALNGMLLYGRAAGVQARLEPVLWFRDRLHMEDRPGMTETDLSISGEPDNINLDEMMKPPALSLDFNDQLLPAERMATSGIFNNARLDYTAFEAVDEMEDKSPNKERENE